jgi:polyribonucleotide nucleotidyltransferase
MLDSELDLVVSGDGNNIVMLEAGAKIVDENIINQALDKAMPALDQLVSFQKEFIQKCK